MVDVSNDLTILFSSSAQLAGQPNLLAPSTSLAAAAVAAAAVNPALPRYPFSNPFLPGGGAGTWLPTAAGGAGGGVLTNLPQMTPPSVFPLDPNSPFKPMFNPALLPYYSFGQPLKTSIFSPLSGTSTQGMVYPLATPTNSSLGGAGGGGGFHGPGETTMGGAVAPTTPPVLPMPPGLPGNHPQQGSFPGMLPAAGMLQKGGVVGEEKGAGIGEEKVQGLNWMQGLNMMPYLVGAGQLGGVGVAAAAAAAAAATGLGVAPAAPGQQPPPTMNLMNPVPRSSAHIDPSGLKSKDSSSLLTRRMSQAPPPPPTPLRRTSSASLDLQQQSHDAIHRPGEMSPSSRTPPLGVVGKKPGQFPLDGGKWKSMVGDQTSPKIMVPPPYAAAVPNPSVAPSHFSTATPMPGHMIPNLGHMIPVGFHGHGHHPPPVTGVPGMVAGPGGPIMGGVSTSAAMGGGSSSPGPHLPKSGGRPGGEGVGHGGSPRGHDKIKLRIHHVKDDDFKMQVKTDRRRKKWKGKVLSSRAELAESAVRRMHGLHNNNSSSETPPTAAPPPSTSSGTATNAIASASANRADGNIPALPASLRVEPSSKSGVGAGVGGGDGRGSQLPLPPSSSASSSDHNYALNMLADMSSIQSKEEGHAPSSSSSRHQELDRLPADHAPTPSVVGVSSGGPGYSTTPSFSSASSVPHHQPAGLRSPVSVAACSLLMLGEDLNMQDKSKSCERRDAAPDPGPGPDGRVGGVVKPGDGGSTGQVMMTQVENSAATSLLELSGAVLPKQNATTASTTADKVTRDGGMVSRDEPPPPLLMAGEDEEETDVLEEGVGFTPAGNPQVRSTRSASFSAAEAMILMGSGNEEKPTTINPPPLLEPHPPQDEAEEGMVDATEEDEDKEGGGVSHDPTQAGPPRKRPPRLSTFDSEATDTDSEATLTPETPRSKKSYARLASFVSSVEDEREGVAMYSPEAGREEEEVGVVGLHNSVCKRSTSPFPVSDEFPSDPAPTVDHAPLSSSSSSPPAPPAAMDAIATSHPLPPTTLSANYVTAADEEPPCDTHPGDFGTTDEVTDTTPPLSKHQMSTGDKGVGLGCATPPSPQTCPPAMTSSGVGVGDGDDNDTYQSPPPPKRAKFISTFGPAVEETDNVLTLSEVRGVEPSEVRGVGPSEVRGEGPESANAAMDIDVRPDVIEAAPGSGTPPPSGPEIESMSMSSQVHSHACADPQGSTDMPATKAAACESPRRQEEATPPPKPSSTDDLSTPHHHTKPSSVSGADGGRGSDPPPEDTVSKSLPLPTTAAAAKTGTSPKKVKVKKTKIVSLTDKTKSSHTKTRVIKIKRARSPKPATNTSTSTSSSHSPKLGAHHSPKPRSHSPRPGGHHSPKPGSHSPKLSSHHRHSPRPQTQRSQSPPKFGSQDHHHSPAPVPEWSCLEVSDGDSAVGTAPVGEKSGPGSWASFAEDAATRGHPDVASPTTNSGSGSGGSSTTKKRPTKNGESVHGLEVPQLEQLPPADCSDPPPASKTTPTLGDSGSSWDKEVSSSTTRVAPTSQDEPQNRLKMSHAHRQSHHHHHHHQKQAEGGAARKHGRGEAESEERRRSLAKPQDAGKKGLFEVERSSSSRKESKREREREGGSGSERKDKPRKLKLSGRPSPRPGYDAGSKGPATDSSSHQHPTHHHRRLSDSDDDSSSHTHRDMLTTATTAVMTTGRSAIGSHDHHESRPRGFPSAGSSSSSSALQEHRGSPNPAPLSPRAHGSKTEQQRGQDFSPLSDEEESWKHKSSSAHSRHHQAQSTAVTAATAAALSEDPSSSLPSPASSLGSSSGSKKHHHHRHRHHERSSLPSTPASSSSEQPQQQQQQPQHRREDKSSSRGPSPERSKHQHRHHQHRHHHHHHHHRNRHHHSHERRHHPSAPSPSSSAPQAKRPYESISEDDTLDMVSASHKEAGLSRRSLHEVSGGSSPLPPPPLLKPKSNHRKRHRISSDESEGEEGEGEGVTMMMVNTEQSRHGGGSGGGGGAGGSGKAKKMKHSKDHGKQHKERWKEEKHKHSSSSSRKQH